MANKSHKQEVLARPCISEHYIVPSGVEMRHKSAHSVWLTRTKRYTHSTKCHRARISKPKTSQAQRSCAIATQLWVKRGVGLDCAVPTVEKRPA